jgi:hypothetical protein
LNEIFNDRTFRFTAPVDQVRIPLLSCSYRAHSLFTVSQNSPPTEPIYLNFDQLYLEAILSSLKTTQNIRNKLISNPQFAINYCKLALLVNVSRVNTTLACAWHLFFFSPAVFLPA